MDFLLCALFGDVFQDISVFMFWRFPTVLWEREFVEFILCIFVRLWLEIECLEIVLVISCVPVWRLEVVMIYVLPGIFLLVIAGSCFVSKTGFGSKEARGGGRRTEREKGHKEGEERGTFWVHVFLLHHLICMYLKSQLKPLFCFRN